MKRPTIALGGIVGTSVVLEIVFRHQAHVELPWHVVPAFDLLYGIAGSLGLALWSKGIVGRLLQRVEDYYEDRN